MELLIAAGVPSAITAFCFWMIERRIQVRAEAEKEERVRRQKEQDAKEENREKLQYMTVKALDYEQEAKHDLENFLTRQGVNHVTGN